MEDEKQTRERGFLYPNVGGGMLGRQPEGRSGPQRTLLSKSGRHRCFEYVQDAPVRTGDLQLLLCGVETKGAFSSPKGRPGYHLHIVMSGKGYIEVDEQRFVIHKGQMFMTDPDHSYRYAFSPEDPWSYCWMSFDGKNAWKYAEDAGFGNGVCVKNCQLDTRDFYHLVKRVLNHPEQTLSNDLMRAGVLLEFLSLAVQSEEMGDNGILQQYGYTPVTYADYAVDFIHLHYASTNINDIARNIGINRSYLTSLFKQRMGVSPQEYLIQYRMGEASRLLTVTDLPVQDIARKVGYSNPLTFSKMFRNVKGISPSQYRRSQGHGNDKNEKSTRRTTEHEHPVS